MPTPMFKVLAQSLRLGQPPDAVSALRVLVEAIEKQSAEIDDLRAKLAIATSRMQYAEARLGRLLEVAEPDLARDEPPPSSHLSAPSSGLPMGHAPAPAPHHGAESGRGSQRPPPMPPAASQPAPRAPSVRPPAIPHALPIPQVPVHGQQGAGHHPPVQIPQPMPLTPSGPQMAPQPQVAQMAPQHTPPQGGPAIPRAPLIPSMPSAPPALHDLVDDGGFDEMNQTLVINKRDVAQVARAEAPFPLSRGAERSRANTAGTPFLQPAMQPPASPAATPQAQAPSAPPASAQPHAAQPHAAQPRPGGLAQPSPTNLRPSADGTKTGIHPHRPSLDPAAERLAEEMGPPSLASIIDEGDEGGSDDFTLTDQTARVDLSGLNELEQRAGMRPRGDRDGD